MIYGHKFSIVREALLKKTNILIESDQKSVIDKNFKKKSISDIKYEIFDIHSSKAQKYIDNNNYLSNLKKKDKLKDYRGEIIVDKSNDDIIGRFLIGTGKDEGYIGALRVADKYKGYGFGDILIKDAINKYNGIDLNVFKDNKVAIAMYKKNGFMILNKYNDKESYYMKLKSKLDSEEKELIKEEGHIL